MPVAVASNTESAPGDAVCKARQVPVQGDDDDDCGLRGTHVAT